MKKLKLLFILLLTTITAFPQSKNDLLDQIDAFHKSVVLNKPYDADRAKVFEAMNAAAAPEYQKILRESESRGFCEYYSEGDYYKETLTLEIANEKPPYRVIFSIKKEYRTKDLYSGVYSDWKVSYDISKDYLFKLQIAIYNYLFGPIKLPGELQAKIDQFNASQTKDRKKIIQGRDF